MAALPPVCERLLPRGVRAQLPPCHAAAAAHRRHQRDGLRGRKRRLNARALSSGDRERGEHDIMPLSCAMTCARTCARTCALVCAVRPWLLRRLKTRGSGREQQRGSGERLWCICDAACAHAVPPIRVFYLQRMLSEWWHKMLRHECAARFKTAPFASAGRYREQLILIKGSQSSASRQVAFSPQVVLAVVQFASACLRRASSHPPPVASLPAGLLDAGGEPGAAPGRGRLLLPPQAQGAPW